MSDGRCKREVVRMERDTVYVERRDSVMVSNTNLKSHVITRICKWSLKGFIERFFEGGFGGLLSWSSWCALAHREVFS